MGDTDSPAVVLNHKGDLDLYADDNGNGIGFWTGSGTVERLNISAAGLFDFQGNRATNLTLDAGSLTGTIPAARLPSSVLTNTVESTLSGTAGVLVDSAGVARRFDAGTIGGTYGIATFAVAAGATTAASVTTNLVGTALITGGRVTTPRVGTWEVSGQTFNIDGGADNYYNALIYQVHNSATNIIVGAGGARGAINNQDSAVISPWRFVVTNTNSASVYLSVYNPSGGTVNFVGLSSGTWYSYLTLTYISTNTLTGGTP
jgi:hypothetical protein